MIKAVILDLDDTLSLTEEACFHMENEVLVRMGRKPMSRPTHQANWGKGQLAQAILERSPGVNFGEFMKVYEQVKPKYVKSGQLDAIPEANLKALDKLVAMGKQLQLLTSRTYVEVFHLLEPDHHLAGRIADFYYKDNMEYHKPNPRAFEYIEHQHGWQSAECVYVGDSIGDAQAAKGAGLHFIASLESGLRARKDFKDYPVDAFINTFPEVVAAVAELDRKLQAA